MSFSSWVVLDDLGFHAGPGGLGRSVQMGEEGHDGHFAIDVRGDGGGDDPVPVLPGVGKAELAEILDQHPAQLQLPRRAGVALRPGAGGSVDLHVSEEALQETSAIHRNLSAARVQGSGFRMEGRGTRVEGRGAGAGRDRSTLPNPQP